MKHYDKLIFEFNKEDRVGYSLPTNEFPQTNIDQSLLRKTSLNLPKATELDVVRHYTNVSHKNFGIETGFYPLGSCTMKYNPKINEKLTSLKGFTNIHPTQSEATSQGHLQVSYELSKHLSEITGMDYYSFAPFAGAHGELVGLMIIKAYHDHNKDFKRTKIVIPDSAHGTNPASAVVSGFEVVEIKSNHDGTVSMEALREVLDENTAGLMLTNPNTAGAFEKDVKEIADLVHEAGGLLYYDGANLNALLGVSRPGDMGFDITHLNLHKTFSTPHGGGGPGSGPVGIKKELLEFLPNEVAMKNENGYYLYKPKYSLGRIGRFHGNVLVYMKAYTYILSLGKEYLSKIGPLALLNANYLKKILEEHFISPIKEFCMHEFVFDGLKNNPHNIKTLDIAKRLLDYGMHAPTIYFPLIFREAMMVEPVETESLETLNEFVSVIKKIVEEAVLDPETLRNAPHHTPVRRLDEVRAVRSPILHYNDYLESIK